MTFSCHVALGASWLGWFLELSSPLMTLTVLRSMGQGSQRRVPFVGIFPILPSQLGEGYRFWEGRSQTQSAILLTRYCESTYYPPDYDRGWWP